MLEFCQYLFVDPIIGDGQVLGTTPDNIDFAEDRQKHSAMLDSLGIDQVCQTSAIILFRRRRSILSRACYSPIYVNSAGVVGAQEV